MDDEGRLARVGSFSAVCSPPLSMMFKGRMSKSSKSKKIELTDELDDEICDALCKISKSSEELWKEVSTIFSPPTPIGSKVSDYTPFDPYKNPNTPNTPNTPTTPARPPNEAEGDHSASNHTALAILAATSGDRAVRQNNANPSAQFLTPYPPNVINKIIHNAGATVPNSIAIPQIVVSNSKDGEEGRREAKMLNDPGFAQPNDAAVRSTTITSLKRPKRTRNDHLSPNSSVKSLSSKAGADGKLNAANINSIINNSGLSDSDGSTTSGDSHEDSLDTHNAHRGHQNQLQNPLSQSAPNPTHHNHTTSPQLQQTTLNNIAGLFSNYNNHNHGNFNFGSHNSAQSNHNHEPSLNFNQQGFSSLGNATTGNNITNFNANNASHASSMYNSNTNNSNTNNNAHNFPTWNDSNGTAVSNNNNNNNNGHACSNCNSCNNHSHNHNHNTNATPNLIGMGLNGNFSTNDKYWTEVIFCCKKLVALAGSGLAGPLSFSELVDALTLARHIMSTTAAVMNSGAYTPFPTDEFNRLVGETFGNFGHNITNNTTATPSSNLHTNLINLNASANNHTYPYFTQGNNSASSTSLPLPHSALTPPSPSPAFSSSHPDTPPSPSLAISSPLSTLGASSSSSAWGSSSSSYAFDESRRKLPIPLPVTKEEDSSDDESPTPSPPPMSPLSTLNVVPLSPGTSPSTPSEKGTKEKEGKEVKEKEGKEGSWKKPRGKKRPKYEADLMCLSCGVRQTPEWRRGPAGAKTLCNACGLHWAKVLKAEGKGDQKKAALLEAKRSQFMLAAQKRTQGK